MAKKLENMVNGTIKLAADVRIYKEVDKHKKNYDALADYFKPTNHEKRAVLMEVASLVDEDNFETYLKTYEAMKDKFKKPSSSEEQSALMLSAAILVYVKKLGVTRKVKLDD